MDKDKYIENTQIISEKFLEMLEMYKKEEGSNVIKQLSSKPKDVEHLGKCLDNLGLEIGALKMFLGIK